MHRLIIATPNSDRVVSMFDERCSRVAAVRRRLRDARAMVAVPTTMRGLRVVAVPSYGQPGYVRLSATLCAATVGADRHTNGINLS